MFLQKTTLNKTVSALIFLCKAHLREPPKEIIDNLSYN